MCISVHISSDIELQTGLQTQLLASVDAIVHVAGLDCTDVGLQLFVIVISVIALHRRDDIRQKVGVCDVKTS